MDKPWDFGGSCKFSQKLMCLRHFESLDDVEDVSFGNLWYNYLAQLQMDYIPVQTGDFPFVKC
jgi:hypothetical protein